MKTVSKFGKTSLGAMSVFLLTPERMIDLEEVLWQRDVCGAEREWRIGLKFKTVLSDAGVVDKSAKNTQGILEKQGPATDMLLSAIYMFI